MSAIETVAGTGVYIVGEVDRIDRRVKVGMTTRGLERVHALQTAGPLELLWWWPCARRSQALGREKYLHQRWSAWRVYGEWFADDGEVAEFVRGPFTLCERRCSTCGKAVNPFYLAEWDELCTSRQPIRCTGRCRGKGTNRCRMTTSTGDIYRYVHKGTSWDRCARCWHSMARSEMCRDYPQAFPHAVVRSIYMGEMTPLRRTCEQ